MPIKIRTTKQRKTTSNYNSRQILVSIKEKSFKKMLANNGKLGTKKYLKPYLGIIYIYFKAIIATFYYKVPQIVGT